MKKLSKLTLQNKMERLDELTDDSANQLKGGYRIYYPDYKNPNVSVDIGSGGITGTHTWRF
jgi:hypothetical protein